MSEAGTINHDTASRLIGVSPGELEALVKSGAVRRSDRNAYSLPVLVQDYTGHLKAEGGRRELAPKQADIAEHLDMSERSVREFLEAVRIDHKVATLSEIRIAYIRRQRDMAAGRFADGDMDLAKERSLLARAQRDKIEMENDEKRGLLIPAEQLEPKLRAAMVAAREAWRNEPSRLAREVQGKTAEEVENFLGVAFNSFLVRLSRWTDAQVLDDVEEEA